jgi:hypothetical protein
VDSGSAEKKSCPTKKQRNPLDSGWSSHGRRLHQLRASDRPDEMLSRKDLAELQNKLSMMGTSALQDSYRSAHFVRRIGLHQAGLFRLS